MIPLTAQEAAAALGVDRVPRAVTGVSIDSRTIREGDLFVALAGDRFDGHAFVAAAFAAGASAAVVRRGAPLDDASRRVAEGFVIEVDDTLAALSGLARAVRRQARTRVIGITGSVGKTSTKDLLRAAASGVASVVATQANENNEIGVPLTLLKIEAETGVAVVEMGMRGRGQILSLARTAEPDVGLITRIAPVHLELVGDLAGVAASKSELFRGLRPGGTAVIPAPEPLLEEQVEKIGVPAVRFAFCRESSASVEAEVWGRALAVDGPQARLEVVWPKGHAEVEVPYSAPYRLENAIAAIAACFAAGLPVPGCVAALAAVRFTPLRGDEYVLGDLLLLDDSYNANPAAVIVAVEDLVRRARHSRGRPVAVLGDMLELGPEALEYHRSVGKRAAQAGVSLLIAVGPLSAATIEGFEMARSARADVERASLHLPDLDDGLEVILSSLRTGDVVLVKGSRGMRLERVVEAIRKSAA